MRIDRYEDARIQGRIGAAAAFGSQPCPGGLPTTDRRQVLGRSSQFGVPLDESLSSRGRRGIGGTRSQRTPAETHPPARASSAGMVPAFAQEFRLSHRTVDCGTDGAGNLSQVANQVSSALSQPVACRAADYAAEAAFPGPRARRRRSAALAARGMAADKKSAARRRAHMVLIDESGFLLSPLVRRTLAPAEKTRSEDMGRPSPAGLGYRRTDHLSIAACLGLYFRRYPKDFVN